MLPGGPYCPAQVISSGAGVVSLEWFEGICPGPGIGQKDLHFEVSIRDFCSALQLWCIPYTQVSIQYTLYISHSVVCFKAMSYQHLIDCHHFLAKVLD